MEHAQKKPACTGIIVPARPTSLELINERSGRPYKIKSSSSLTIRAKYTKYEGTERTKDADSLKKVGHLQNIEYCLSKLLLRKIDEQTTIWRVFMKL